MSGQAKLTPLQERMKRAAIAARGELEDRDVAVLVVLDTVPHPETGGYEIRIYGAGGAEAESPVGVAELLETAAAAVRQGAAPPKTPGEQN